MNIIRTIERKEDYSWIRKLFEDRSGDKTCGPEFPPRFPLSMIPRQDVSSSFFYLSFNNFIIGYSEIDRVEISGGVHVGKNRNSIDSKCTIVLKSELKKIYKFLPFSGFMGIRYVEDSLHDKSYSDAVKILKRL